MSHRSVNRFNQREVSRALRAARRAGENVDRVEIDPKSGKIAVVIRSDENHSNSNDTPERIISKL